LHTSVEDELPLPKDRRKSPILKKRSSGQSGTPFLQLDVIHQGAPRADCNSGDEAAFLQRLVVVIVRHYLMDASMILANPHRMDFLRLAMIPVARNRQFHGMS
jgi:hypothetical protein